jgi:hypothetical protein
LTTVNKNNYHLLEKPKKHTAALFSTGGTMAFIGSKIDHKLVQGYILKQNCKNV